MRIEFHPEAQDEFISAAHFYERHTEASGSTSSLRFSAHTNARSSLPPLAHRLAGGSGAFSFRSFPSVCCIASSLNASRSSRSCTFTANQVTGDHGFEALLAMNHPVKGKSYSAGRPGAGEPDAPVSARASENAAATPRPMYMPPVIQRWPVMNRGLAARIHRLAEPAAMA